VVIEDGFLGYVLDYKKLFDVVSCDLRNGKIFQEEYLELVECGVVVAQGVTAEVARFSC
jgi:spermidine synthase